MAATRIRFTQFQCVAAPVLENGGNFTTAFHLYGLDQEGRLWARDPYSGAWELHDMPVADKQ